MDSNIIIFADTNKIYGLYRAVACGSDLQHSALIESCLRKGYQIVISDFVLEELKRICLRHKTERNKHFLDRFFQKTGFHISQSSDLDATYNLYVDDEGDAQILQDAVEISADYLLTGNTKDFHIKSIYDRFGITVISDIDYINPEAK